MRAEREFDGVVLSEDMLRTMREANNAALDAGKTDISVVANWRITAEGNIEVEKLFSLDTPSLEALSHILRHRELWPKEFVWDYQSCSTCAMGLASKLWNYDTYREVDDSAVLQAVERLGMEHEPALRILGGSHLEQTYGTTFYCSVTPEMVADQIDKYLASR